MVIYRGTTRNEGGGREVCNTNKRQSAREVCKFEGKQEHIRNSYRAFRNRSQQPISSLRAQLFRISSHISASDVLPVSTSFSLCMCVCVCVYPRFYISIVYHVCVYILVKHSKVFYRKISSGDVSHLTDDPANN